MISGIVGKKIGMTSIFQENGDVVPVTVLEAGPCNVIQVKSIKRDGYDSAQVGYGELTKKHKLKKPLEGHFKKANSEPKKKLKEFKMTGEGDPLKVGTIIDVDTFQEGENVDIVGISKGKGFAGVMKRHGFKGFPASRGTHESFRGGGSIGMCADPARVFKGKKMAGHMGAKQITAQNLKVIKVIKEKHQILVKGAVPGANGSIITIKKRNS